MSAKVGRFPLKRLRNEPVWSAAATDFGRRAARAGGGKGGLFHAMLPARAGPKLWKLGGGYLPAAAVPEPHCVQFRLPLSRAA